MSDSFEFCLKDINGDIPLLSHMESKKHEKNALKFEKSDNTLGWKEEDFVVFIGMCTLCWKFLNLGQRRSNPNEIVFNSKKEFEDHLTSENHLKNVEVNKTKNTSLEDHQGFFVNCVGICKRCNCPLNSVEQIKNHIKGRRHRNKF